MHVTNIAQGCCKACAEKRQHTADEWQNHPLAGHGYTPESGWTHPELKTNEALSDLRP